MKIDCETLRRRIPDYLDGAMSQLERQKFEEELAHCPEVRDELLALQQLESDIDSIPYQEVPFSVDTSFFNLLEQEKQKQKVGGWWLRIAASVSLLIVGFAGGYVISPNGNSDSELISLKNEMSEMKELVMLSMIDNPRASERIQAVNYVDDLEKADTEIIDMLSHTLNTDDSPNVRLAAAQALKKFASDPVVRSELVKAMEFQTDPIIQIALINIMVELEEKSAIKQLRDWQSAEDINDVVKKQAEIGLQILI